MSAAIDRQRSLSFLLNGRPVSAMVGPGTMLLDVLRDQFGLTSLKNGCQPQGQCGCCAVLLDGKRVLSCCLPATRVEGRDVLTPEGLEADIREQISRAFLDAGAVQCGFCTPGIVMSAVSLIRANPQPSRADILQALRPHLCRCTGYVKIVEAIERYAAYRLSGHVPEPDCLSGGVGSPTPRQDGKDLVLGERPFVDDLRLEGMLYAAPRLSDYPRAILKGIDSTPTLAIPGVRRVITASDVPGERYQGLIEKDWPVFVAEGEATRYVGDMIAVVVADTMETARRGAQALKVDYEPLEAVCSPLAALEDHAPAIHPKGNLLSRSIIRRGDAESALRESAFVVDESFQTQCIEHLFLEPESCVAAPADEGRLHIYSQGQGVFDDRRQIAGVLGWNPERVEVKLVPCGGAFGGREDLSIQAQTALATVLCGQTVKMTLTREESFRVHPKRHPIEMHYRVGCDTQGRLTAVRARMIGDTGAYASVGAKVLERAAGHACGPYRVAHIDVEALAVYTNNPPCGAMRGFGVNQAAFAIEGCLDRLAEKAGLDGWEIRWRNALEQGDLFSTGQRLNKPFGLKQTLEAVRQQYREARYAGIACGVKNVGIGNGLPEYGKACIEVTGGDSAALRVGFTEMGQGLLTICAQIACEETRLAPDTFDCQVDTSEELDCGQTTASRATVLAGHAVRDAAQKLNEELSAGKSLCDLIGRKFYGLWACPPTDPLDSPKPEPNTHLTYGWATQVVILDKDGGLLNVIAAHDVGRVINPLQLQGQMEGAIHMGLGYALTEEFRMKEGYIETAKMKDYRILRAHHMPEVATLFIEVPDPETPYGARGVGEIGLVPTAAAVAGALYAFDGIRRNRLPMNDSPAARAILTPLGGSPASPPE